MLAQIELMKLAAQDELEAQKLDAESAALKAESQYVLQLAEAKPENEILDQELNLAPSYASEAGSDMRLPDGELNLGLESAEAKLESEIPDENIILSPTAPKVWSPSPPRKRPSLGLQRPPPKNLYHSILVLVVRCPWPLRSPCCHIVPVKSHTNSTHIERLIPTCRCRVGG